MVYQASSIEAFGLPSNRAALPPLALHPSVHAAGELAVGSTLAAYATWNGSSWTAGATQSMNRASALTLDQAGTAYVAGGQYPDPDYGPLNLAHLTSTRSFAGDTRVYRRQMRRHLKPSDFATPIYDAIDEVLDNAEARRGRLE